MSGKRATTLIAAFLFLGVASYGQDIDLTNSPTWLIFEKGKQLFDTREYGEALLYFRSARERQSSFPEVEYWIGRIFEAEGELSLAERQYRSALSVSRYLETPDDEFQIRYQLANLQLITHSYSLYSDSLDEIIKLDRRRRKSDSLIDIEPALLVDALVNRGLDKLLELYRLDDYGGVDAYYRSGIYHYRRGFYEQAIEDLAYGIVISSTNMLQYLLRHDPEYRFSTIDAMMIDISRSNALVDYARNVDFYGQFYALGVSLYASQEQQKKELARDIWRTISSYGPESSVWAVKSKLQLANPFSDQFGITFVD